MTKKLLMVLAAGFIFASPALAATKLGSLHENISVGKILSIGLNQSPNGQWYIYSNSNSAVASAKTGTNTLLITGKSAGAATLLVCTDASGNNCMQVTVSVLASGQVLGASTVTAHPVKSWVSEGKTIFYVDADGLIPVSTWSIFLSNGGKQSLIQPADSADLALPLEPLMKSHDSRV